MSDRETIDPFSDRSLVEGPHPYFGQPRSACPIPRAHLATH